MEDNMRKAKKLLSSPLFLAAVIASLLLPLLCIAAYSSRTSAAAELLNELRIPLLFLSDGNSVMNFLVFLAFQPFESILFAALVQAPALVFAVGLLLTYLAAGKPDDGAGISRGLKLAGIGLLLVMLMKVIGTVVSAAAVLMVASGIEKVAGPGSPLSGLVLDTSVIWNAAGSAAGTAAVALAAQVWFLVQARKFASAVAKMVSDGSVPRVSKLFHVLCYLWGGAGILYSFASSEKVLGILSEIALGLVYILFAVFIGKITDGKSVPAGAAVAAIGATGAAMDPVGATGAALDPVGATGAADSWSAVQPETPQPAFELPQTPPQPAFELPQTPPQPAFELPKTPPQPAFELPQTPPQPAFELPKTPPQPAFELPKAPPQPAYNPPKTPPQPVQRAVPTRQNAMLLQRRTGDNIPVTSANFVIGRNPAQCSLVIADNPVISGTHATVGWMNGTYFLVDNNSRNHVYLNGQQLQPGMKVKLNHCSQFRLGNEEFVFILY